MKKSLWIGIFRVFIKPLKMGLIDEAGTRVKPVILMEMHPVLRLRLIQATFTEKIKMLSLSTNSRLKIVKKSGHNIHIDQPEIFINSVKQVVLSLR